MEKQVELLLRALTKGVSKLPDTVDLIVKQYAIKCWATAAFEVLFSIVFCYITLRLYKILKVSVSLQKKEKLKAGYCYDDSLSGIQFFYITFIILSAVFSISLAFMSASDVVSALSPVYSLINDLR